MMSKLANCTNSRLDESPIPAICRDASGASEMTWNCPNMQLLNEPSHCPNFCFIRHLFTTLFLSVVIQSQQILLPSCVLNSKFFFYNCVCIGLQKSLQKSSYITSPLAPDSLSEWFFVKLNFVP